MENNVPRPAFTPAQVAQLSALTEAERDDLLRNWLLHSGNLVVEPIGPLAEDGPETHWRAWLTDLGESYSAEGSSEQAAIEALAADLKLSFRVLPILLKHERDRLEPHPEQLGELLHLPHRRT
jgi:hypothetical protein